jgi:hypothetical protein
MDSGKAYIVLCETQLIEFVDDITRNIDAGKQTDCLIMDFSKAASWSDEIVKYAIVSSAKSLTFDVIPSGMSFI